MKKPVPHPVHSKTIYEKVPVVESYDCNEGCSDPAWIILDLKTLNPLPPVTPFLTLVSAAKRVTFEYGFHRSYHPTTQMRRWWPGPSVDVVSLRILQLVLRLVGRQETVLLREREEGLPSHLAREPSLGYAACRGARVIDPGHLSLSLFSLKICRCFDIYSLHLHLCLCPSLSLCLPLSVSMSMRLPLRLIPPTNNASCMNKQRQSKGPISK